LRLLVDGVCTSFNQDYEKTTFTAGSWQTLLHKQPALPSCVVREDSNFSFRAHAEGRQFW